MDRSKVKSQVRPSLHQNDHARHWELLINFFLIATSALFIYISVAYYVTWYENTSYVSKYHVLAMLLLLPSGYLMRELTKCFDHEADWKLITNLGISMISAILFCSMQWLAWEDKILSDPDASIFIFYLVVAHGAYTFFTLIGTMVATFVVGRKLSDPIKRLIFYTNGFERMKLNLWARVWLFINVSWAVILAFFLLIA